MNRRSFLASLGVALGTVAAGPTLLSLVPTPAPPQLGISIRMIRQYDISERDDVCRYDVLYGFATFRPDFACRVAA